MKVLDRDHAEARRRAESDGRYRRAWNIELEHVPVGLVDIEVRFAVGRRIAEVRGIGFRAVGLQQIVTNGSVLRGGTYCRKRVEDARRLPDPG